ncbi:MAG: N-formylglutamate amidohydrolase [Pseudomonadota bacterium]
MTHLQSTDRRITLQDRLLTPEEPAPVMHWSERCQAGLVLVCEHSGQTVPSTLGTPGLQSGDRYTNVGGDIGAGALTCAIADRPDAPAVQQTCSRLFIDCNAWGSLLADCVTDILAEEDQ